MSVCGDHGGHGGGYDPFDGPMGLELPYMGGEVRQESTRPYNPANVRLEPCCRQSSVLAIISAAMGIGVGAYYFAHRNDESIQTTSTTSTSPSSLFYASLACFGVTALAVAVRCCKNKAAASGDSANGVNRAGVDQASVQSPSVQHAYVQHRDSPV